MTIDIVYVLGPQRGWQINPGANAGGTPVFIDMGQALRYARSLCRNGDRIRVAHANGHATERIVSKDDIQLVAAQDWKPPAAKRPDV